MTIRDTCRRSLLTTVGSIAVATTAGCVGTLVPGGSRREDGPVDVDVTLETTDGVDDVGAFEVRGAFVHTGDGGRKLVVKYHVQMADDFGDAGDCVDVLTTGTAYDSDGSVVDEFSDGGIPLEPGQSGDVNRVFDDHVDTIASVELDLRENPDQSACDG